MEQQKDEVEIDLLELFWALLRKWWMIAIVAVLCAAIGFSYAKFYLPETFTSSIRMYVKNSNSTETVSSVTTSDLNASKSLVMTYIVILKDPVVVGEVAENLAENHERDYLKRYFALDENGCPTTGSILNYVSMGAVDNTEVLKVSATTPNAKLSAEISNIFAEVAPDYLIRIVGAGSVEIIGAAVPATVKSGPSVSRYTIIGFLIGFILVAAAIVIRTITDNTFRDAEDINKKFGLSVLGEVMDYGTKKDKKKRRNVDPSKKIILVLRLFLVRRFHLA